jgi:CDP-diacylglycerol--glycerol-3-phosphate 3-phosphatidyltransferase
LTDLDFSLGLVMATLVVVVAYAGRVSRSGPAHHARVERAGGSPLLGKGAMEMGYWAMRPLARACIAAGLTANAVSWLSLGLAALAGVALAAGAFGVGAVLSLASSACDALDGMIARETGTAGDAGEVLDAAIDRYAELFFFGGLAFHERFDGSALLLTLAATAGAIMVSYSTAKAEALGVPAPRGSMRRQERAVYLGVGVALVPIVAAVAAASRGSASGVGLPDWVSRWPLFAVLALVAVVGNASAIRRFRVIAEAVRRPAPLRPDASTSASRLARESHAAAGDAVR